MRVAFPILTGKRNKRFAMLSLVLIQSLLTACGGSPEQSVAAPIVVSTPPPVAGPDADSDGVADVADLCAGTPTGYSVDADGCSVQHCREISSQGVSACFATVAVEAKACYDTTGAACVGGNATVALALSGIAGPVSAACATDAVVQAAGFGNQLTVAGLQGLLAEACQGNVQQMASRIYGGPHAKLLNAANPLDEACLHSAYDEAQNIIQSTYDEYAACILDASCNGSAVEANRAARDTQAQVTLSGMCPTMRQTMGSQPVLYVERANAQGRCMVAEGHADTSNVTLDCGPDNDLFNNLVVKEDDNSGAVLADIDAIANGQDVQVQFGPEWGSLCADGSNYAVLMRLAPNGDIGKVIMEQEGGGVCLTPADCQTRPVHYFEAFSRTSADKFTRGYHAIRADNPFTDWSKVFQTYCTQDLHIGGGTTVPGGPPATGGVMRRWGAINVRTSTRFFRDLLWRRARHTSATGYLPADPVVIFSGTSAGGYGVAYNLHYPLDEMRWANTIGNPHVAFTVGGGATDLGLLFTGFGSEANWDTRPYQPPYCLEDNCSLTEFNHPAHGARMGATPLQKMLHVSPQHDDTQEPTQGYLGAPGMEPKDWINEVRRVYCQNQHGPNVFYHMGANTQPRHDFINTDAVFDHNITFTRQLLVNGTGMLTWMHNHTLHPAETMDRVETGDTLPGVVPFACTPGPVDPTGDFDGDLVQNLDDICPGTPSGAAVALNGCPLAITGDADQDGIGDAFDYCAATSTIEVANDFGCAPSQDDIDGDGFLDPNDNCPSISNPSQANADADFLGDACD